MLFPNLRHNTELAKEASIFNAAKPLLNLASRVAPGLNSQVLRGGANKILPAVSDQYYKYRGLAGALKPGIGSGAGWGAATGGALGGAVPLDENSSSVDRLKNILMGAVAGGAGGAGIRGARNFQAYRPNIKANQEALTTLKSMGISPGPGLEIDKLIANGGGKSLMDPAVLKQMYAMRNTGNITTLSGEGLGGQVLPKMTAAMRQLKLDTINAGQVINPHMMAGLNSPAAQKMMGAGGINRVYGTAQAQLKPISPQQRTRLQHLNESVKADFGRRKPTAENLYKYVDDADHLDDKYYKWLGLNQEQATEGLTALNNPAIRKLRYVWEGRKPVPFDVRLNSGPMPAEGYYNIPMFNKVQQRRFNNLYGAQPVAQPGV